MNQIKPEDYFRLKKMTNTVHTEDLRYVVFLTSAPDRKVYRTNSDVVILDTETGMTNILERKKQITAMTASGCDVLIQYAPAYRAKTAKVCRYEVGTGTLKETLAVSALSTDAALIVGEGYAYVFTEAEHGGRMQYLLERGGGENA